MSRCLSALHLPPWQHSQGMVKLYFYSSSISTLQKGIEKLTTLYCCSPWNLVLFRFTLCLADMGGIKKGKFAKMKTAKKNVTKQILRQFLSGTTIHGCRYTVDAQFNLITHVFWTILTVSFLCLGFFLVVVRQKILKFF